jgi:NitT/TauT family transport system ATP-binding protein
MKENLFVSIRSASLTYGEEGEGGVLALRDASLGIGQGEFTAIVGPSGCGKSTLLKLVSGLRRPSVGSVAVDGAEVMRPLKIVGMAFQNPTLLPWRSSLANVLLPLEIVEPHRSRFRRDRKEFEARARALFAKVGLAGAEGHYPWQLSGGMQQRVSLCRALIHDPALLLLDEPFGALDAFTREELWETLQTLWLDRRFTTLLVTHDLIESVFLADTVHVVSARPGRIVYSRSIPLPRPRRLEDRYKPEFVDIVHDLRDHIGRAREAAAA